MVAQVSGEGQTLALERAVVEHLARRDDISEAEAQARALSTLRLVAARRVELGARDQPPEHPDELDPARREQLERAALVRVWLDEVFEPSHRAADIPQRVIDQNMADPSRTRRLFHPELWFVCQVLMVPTQPADGTFVKPPSEGEAAQQWLAAANAAFAPLVARVHRVEPELVTEDGCAVLGRIVGTSEVTFAGPEQAPDASMIVRFERFAFAPSDPGNFDPQWVEAVTAGAAGPGVVGPFATGFGLHLVVVTNIEPAAFADGSLPEAQLRAAREAHLRGEIEHAWQADQLQQTLAKIRDRRVVRLSPELERGP
ncbi:hypothetical protein ENSA7_09570 [Enhygromyxa salina]|uniref:PpiC domain-containing protein n=2 Tax=Enhygromyxa salina TaxID=215803 RepID=A0A2S9YW01_9BACT|nr:hypothetical protein ENSA7_09570 [Enhygromyxa salina]